MIIGFTKKYAVSLLCFLLAVFLLSKMLLPGYVLTLDMTWTPAVPTVWSADGLNNTFPILAFIHTLSLIVPAWLVQKMVLVVLFFLLFFMPYKFLPFVEGMSARIFATGIFALNPFVYSRVLAGQWFHLLGYAFLPLLLYALVPLSQKPDRRSAIIFFLALCLIGLLSIHFLYLACVLSGLWLFFYWVRDWWSGGEGTLRMKSALGWVSIVGACLLVVNLFWIVPAMMRSAPLEARFDQTYYSVFAASGTAGVPVMANVAVLGGFWGESQVWGKYFVWPQSSAIFWMAVVFTFIFIGWGVWILVNNPKTRFHALVLLGIGILAYVTALGTADTPFQNFNLFLYQHIPFWSGLRDSHKIAGVLALVYAVFAGVGVGGFLSFIKKRSVSAEAFISMLVLLVPIIFGMYMWGGMHGQLRPVWYPNGWYEAKAIIDKMPAGEKVLVLPWHGYLSLDFADNKIVANPTASFFGRDRIVASKTVELGKIYDQEVSTEYRDIDTFLRNAQNLSPDLISAGLKSRGITSILILINPGIEKSEEGLTYWKTEFSKEKEAPLGASKDKTWSVMLEGKSTTIFEDPAIIIKHIQP